MAAWLNVVGKPALYYLNDAMGARFQLNLGIILTDRDADLCDFAQCRQSGHETSADLSGLTIGSGDVSRKMAEIDT